LPVLMIFVNNPNIKTLQARMNHKGTKTPKKPFV